MMKQAEDDFGFIPYNQVKESREDDFDFIPVHAYQKSNSNQQSSNLQTRNPEKENPSFLQNVASHPYTQAALGAAKYLTWPLDVLKLAMQGEGLSGLDEIEQAFEREGKPFDRNDYINSLMEFTNSVPTQQYIEDLVKEKTGIDLAPKDALGRIIRQGSEILSTGPKGLLESGAAQIGKRAAGAIGGAGLSEGLKQAGAPEILSDIAGYAVGGSLAGKSTPKQLSPEGKELTQIAEKHGLKQFEGMQREVAPKNPIVSSKKQGRLTSEINETSKKAIEQVIENKLPIKKLRDSGIDLKEAYTEAFHQADTTAKNLSNEKIDLKDTINWISNKKQNIKSSAPSLSQTDETLLKELRKHEKAFKKAKDVSPQQALDQYKNFNEELSGLYRKPQFTGSENAIRGLYEELKSEWIKSIEKTSPELASELKFANKVFSETANLNMVEGILEKSFKNGYDPKKLSKNLGGNKSRAFLQRALGKDSVKDLVDIAKYGEKANEKVLSKLKNPKTALEVVKEMTPLKLGLLALKGGFSYSTYGLPFAWEIAKNTINRAQGALFTRASTRKSYIDYLKKASNLDSPAFKKASQELSKKIDQEFGSEEDLIEEDF